MMLRNIFICSLLFHIFIQKVISQTNDTLTYISDDTIPHKLSDSMVLNEVIITSYFDAQPQLRSPASIAVIDNSKLELHSNTSLVPALNTIPGLRMEERSPGSYRLSIRGSLLRSPFGIRNVKIYLDEFPLTDAGGNSYLNLIDINAIHRIEVIKGPDGSLFGANSGGVFRITPVDLHTDSFQIASGLTYGSYNSFHHHLNLNVPIGKNIISFKEGIQTSDGFRDNSALDRKYFQLADRWNYSSAGQLRLFMFYSDLKYQTPGGLTLLQWQQNPRAARPANSTLPGAEEQKAGVHNKTFYGGALNDWKINNYVRHVIAVFGSTTDFENPFITNYETRDENSYGLRSWFAVSNHKEGLINLTFDAGVEAQQTNSIITNYGNRWGMKDTVQHSDELKVRQYVVFGRTAIDLYNRFRAELSASINYNRYEFTDLYPIITVHLENEFTPQLMPRIAVSYLLSDMIALRASISKGFSPPTLAEIRSSDNYINLGLQPETGWNYEAGLRIHDKRDRLRWDVSVFYYKLQEAIVRQLNAGGDEYFINAGGTEQPGVESQLTLNLNSKQIIPFINKVQLSNSSSFSYFKFRNYTTSNSNYDGKELTGVPEKVIATSLLFHLPSGFSLLAQHNFTSRIPLNDANTVYSNEYHLIQIKLYWQKIYPEFQLKIFCGIDNITNKDYSLGNDLNAFGNRYYNPAAGRNYIIGIRLNFE